MEALCNVDGSRIQQLRGFEGQTEAERIGCGEQLFFRIIDMLASYREKS